MITMKYQDARELIRQGDPIFTRDKGPAGWLIRAWSGSSVNHIGGAVDVKGRLFVSQAAARRGVHPVLLSEFLRRRKRSEIYLLPCDLTDSQREDFGYLFAGLWGLRYESLRGMIGTGFGREKPTKNKRWFCSESYTYAYRGAGGKLLTRGDGLTWPGHILEAFGGLENAIKLEG
jgi:hypothetical protein